jgi:hypothetical protein
MIGLSPLASFCLFSRTGGRERGEDRRVEGADGAQAPREGAALVAVEAREPHERAGVAGIGVENGEKRELGTAHAVEIDHRLGDAAGERMAGGVRRVARHRRLDAAGERDHLARERGLGEHRQGEAVPARIARRDRLAGERSRAGAAQRIAAIGADSCGAGHAAPGLVSSDGVGRRPPVLAHAMLLRPA